MKYALVVATLMVSFCASSVLADEGQVSKNMLSEMGLSGLHVMTDVQGLEIRGRFVRVWGQATFGTITRSYDLTSSFNISGSVHVGGSWAFSWATAF